MKIASEITSLPPVLIDGNEKKIASSATPSRKDDKPLRHCEVGTPTADERSNLNYFAASVGTPTYPQRRYDFHS